MLPAETFIIKAIGNDKIIQQDDTNSSSMLEMNGKQSSSKHTRYINIILYFNMKHKIKSGEMKLLFY